ncbi:MAG: 3-phosphoshikimate 1-carboxyvinyltransferase [Chlamydiia bacterium]|nr:3-phosphoshikimate 1-carboxyvinyltransferase [Chlamydiia bacterium]
MHTWKIRPSTLSGMIQVPPSKSQSMRALLCASFAAGTSHLYGLLESPDVDALCRVCRQFGAELSGDCEHMIVRGVAGQPKRPLQIDAGNSGIVLRFCTALACLVDGMTEVTGDATIRDLRPVQPLVKGLEDLGVSVSATGASMRPPLIVDGMATRWACRLDGEDSQPVSALLLLAAFREGCTRICVDSLGEEPWVEMTLEWLRRLGVVVYRHGKSDFSVIGNTIADPFVYRVPGDWSTAAFPIVAGIMAGKELCVRGLDCEDLQGDRKILEVLGRMGADFSYRGGDLRIRSSSLRATSVDMDAMIDALPILAVLATAAEGETHLYNAAGARVKECDRVATMARALEAMGADVREEEDGLRIRKSQLYAADIGVANDHRVAMALAVAALSATGETRLNGVDCCAKTYGGFREAFRHLGADIEAYAVDTNRVYA